MDPTEGDLGVAAKLFVPTDPTRSLISLRMKAVDQGRMPPLGSRVAHAAGIAVIDGWITQTTTCPGPVDAGTD